MSSSMDDTKSGDNIQSSKIENDHITNDNNTDNIIHNSDIDPAFTENQINDSNSNSNSNNNNNDNTSPDQLENNMSDTNQSIIENQDNTIERHRRHIADADDDDDDDEKKEAKLDQNIMNTPTATDTNETQLDNKPISSRQALEEKLDLLLKKPKVKRSRKDEDDLEQYLDEKILRLKDEMNIAAQMDIDTLNKRIETGDTNLIAIQKVKLLPKVEEILSKANLADTILDNNLLQSVRIWLEPLPDGSLPSFEIQKSLFSAINNLPIKTEHLKESGLGRVMIFYTKSKRVEPQLARLAEKLIAEWTRPIIGASDNYRDLRITKLEFDSEQLRKKNALDSAKRKKRNIGNSPNNKRSNPQTLYEQAAARRGRAAAPAQTTTDYKYAPVSNVAPINTTARTTGVGSTLNNSDLYKRLTSRLSKKK
ncbi:transcription factor SPN1 PWA37_000833 [Arxiozyma heterogenica]|uniref:TFIIS N-terminal domain-containing protein n=1 Tax=Arxiozyma heterogenica TaxID=278026 RepID=A0AAN7WP33_9SACH|nr:hypothetical protein RI543_000644 [Kazachstania heterogenica]